MPFGGCYATVKCNLNSTHPSLPGESQGSPRELGDGAGTTQGGPPGRPSRSEPPAPTAIPTRLDFPEIDQGFATHGRPCLSLDDALSGTGFALPMPPPNITGKLHLGHALDLGLQDALIRRARSRGAATSWIAGCDHAGQSSHDKLMAAHKGKLGWDTPAKRRRYWGKAWARAESMKDSIMGQFGALQPLAQLSDPRFTLDQGYRDSAHAALDALIAKRRIRLIDGALTLDLREEARELCAALLDGTIQIEPIAHRGRLLDMLGQERLWEIGRDFPWGFQAGLAFDAEGFATGAGERTWTMDTWFTSSIWPMAIQGPGAFFDALIIGYDIAYFWGARMLMMARALDQPWPFKRMMLHGLIRDAKGEKFSKSLGNGIDPLEIIAKEGSDALRMWCCHKAAWGADFKWNPAELAAGSKWITKIANAARLFEMRRPAALGAEADLERKAWPGAFAAQGDQFEAAFEEDMRELRLDQACERLREFGRAAWCEGFLGPDSKTWETEPQAWLDALAGQRRLLALAHPFAPAATWWLDSKLRALARSIPKA